MLSLENLGFEELEKLSIFLKSINKITEAKEVEAYFLSCLLDENQLSALENQSVEC